MKKIIPCLFILFFHALKAQLDVGLHASSHISAYKGNIQSNEPFEFQGYSIGMRTARDLKKWDAQAGLLFTQMDLGVVRQGPSELPTATVLHLQTRSLEIQLLARRKFNRVKKVFPYVAAGVSNYLFTHEINFDSGVDPQWFEGKRKTSDYNISLLTVMGLKCRLDHRFSVDLEPNFKYFFLHNTSYRHNISAGLAITCNYLITGKGSSELAELGLNP